MPQFGAIKTPDLMPARVRDANNNKHKFSGKSFFPLVVTRAQQSTDTT